MRAGRFTWLVFGLGLAASVLLTLLLWPYGFFFLFLLPFFFRFPRRTRTRQCPRCGWTTADADAQYCPRDATPLEPS